jgi:plasmid stabilization system protein ParE
MSLQPGISGRAEADLSHQYRWYLDNASVAVAERFLASFDATVVALARHPGMGSICRFRAAELTGFSLPADRRTVWRPLGFLSDGWPAIEHRTRHARRARYPSPIARSTGRSAQPMKRRHWASPVGVKFNH